jgi:Family of unknown function (DUF5719)
MRGLWGQLALPRAVGLVAVGVGLVIGATHLPVPINLAHGTGAAVKNAQADPVTQTRPLCPGPEALGVEGLADSLAQTVSVAAVSAPPASLPAGFATGQGCGSLTLGGLAPGGTLAGPMTGRAQIILAQVSTATSVLVTGVGSLAPGTAATQWSWTKTGDSRGLVTTDCVPAAASSWLIAGGAAPGRLKHLALANPGPSPVTVDLAVFGVNGQIESPIGLGLVVARYSCTVILLDAIAGSEPSPVVHVTARGGKVAAFLSDTWLDGLVPRGGDDVVSLAEPAREQVIAGVPIDGRAVLRIAVPGDSEAVVQSRVLTPSGPRPLPAQGVRLVAAGSTKDIDLSSLPPGAYAVQVRADVPVVAAVMVERGRAAGAPSDLAWSVASPPIKALSGMALPAYELTGLSERLDLVASDAPASVRVTTVGADGQASTRELAIGANSVSALALDGATSVWVTSLTGVVRAAVITYVTDVAGVLLSVTPLRDLPLTATSSPLRQLRDQ